MAEGTIPPSPDPEPHPFLHPDESASAHAPAAPAPPPPKRKRRRLWPKVLLALLILLILLVVLAPTLLSTAPARSFVVGKINQGLKGRVEIADWSLGWRSPVTVSGVKVFDKAGVQIVELPRLTTELTLLNALRGDLRLGNVTVEGLDLLLRRDPKGEVNFSELTGPSAGPKAKSKSGPTRLPNVSGELHLVNCRATYEDHVQGQTFYFPSIAGVVKVPDINQPIEHMLDIACKVGDSPPGKLSVAGKADIGENNILQDKRPDLEEKLTIQGVQLGSLTFLFGKDAPIQKLAGMTDGVLTVRYKGGDGATAEGTLTSTAVAVSGPALKGDTFATQKLALVLPPTTVNMAGSEDWHAWEIRVGAGAGAADAITLTIDQGKVELASDATVQSLLNLAENRAPGAPGRVRANVDLDVAALARQMPKTFALEKDLTLESGRLTHAAEIELAIDRAVVRRLETHLTEVRGRNARGPFSIQPIDLSLAASTFGGGWKVTPVESPDIRELSLTFKSGFANAQFTGPDFSQISGSAAGDLQRLRDELGQVFDLGEVQLAGALTARIDYKGDVVGTRESRVHAAVTVDNLLIQGIPEKGPVREKRVLVDAEIQNLLGQDLSPRSVRGVITCNAGDPAGPTVDASLGFERNTEPRKTTSPGGPTTTNFKISKFVVDLPKAKEEFGSFASALQGYTIQRGTLSVNGSGTYDGSNLNSDTQIALTNFTLQQGAARAELLRDESIAVAAKASGPADFSALTIDSADVKGSVLSAGVRGAVLQLKVGQGASARPAGTLEMVRAANVTADVPDLGKLQALAEAFSSPQAPAAARAPAPAAGSAPAPAPVRGSDVISRPQRGATPAPAPAPAASADAAPPPPLKWGGAASVKLAVARQGERVVVTPTVTGRNVTVARGAVTENLGDVSLITAVSYVPVAPPAPKDSQPPLISEQLRDVQVPSLTANVAGSTITLAEPVVISDVAGLQRLIASLTEPAANPPGPAPATVKAALAAKGDVGKLLAVLKVLQASNSPAGYSGTYALEQRLTGGKDGLAFAGSVNVDNFAVVGGAAKPPAGPGGFAEKAIRLANDVRLDAGRHSLAIRDVSLDMQSTKALQLKLSGNVLEYSTQRRLENVQGTLGYDWAKLWEIVKPMLSKEQQENLKLRIAGQAQRSFALGGSFPAVGADGKPLPFNQAIKFLTGHVEGGFDVVEVDGITIEKLELPLTLRDGLFTVAYANKPQGQNLPPLATCNGGKLNIGGAVVNLAEDVPRLNLPKGLKLLQGATLNPLFADTFGQMINNPLFVSASEARGLVDITVVECNRLPLDTLVLKNAPENDGHAEFLFSIQDVYLGNSVLLDALKFSGQQGFAQSMQGDIRDSRVDVRRGKTQQNVVFNVGEKDRPLRIAGTTVLETKAISIDITIPPPLLRQMGQFGREILKVYPDGWPVPVSGTVTSPRPDFQRALAKVQQDLVPGLLEGLLNRGARGKEGSSEPAPAADRGGSPRKGKDTGNTAPAQPDPVKDLFDAIGRKIDEKDKSKDKDREKRRRERERKSQDAPRQTDEQR